MKKITAHLILGVFDIASVAACVYVVLTWIGIYKNITYGAEYISIQSNISLIGIMVMVPFVHFMTLLRWGGLFEKWANRLLFLFFLFFLFGVLLVDSYIESKISLAGYKYCVSQSERMTFSERRNYVSEYGECQY